MSAREQAETQLRIGELARCAGVTSRAIRHYHSTGLLPEPARDASGYRRYGPGDLVRLVHICRLRALGMPIDQIASVLAGTPDAGADLPAALLALADDVDAEIDRLRGVHDRLITMAESDELDDAADLLTAGLRVRGLLEPAEGRAAYLVDAEPYPVEAPARDLVRGISEDVTGSDRFNDLLDRFRSVTGDEVESLAQAFAAVIPTPRDPVQAVDLPMMDRLLGDRLTAAQRECMIRLRTLLQARAPALGVDLNVRR
jgi:DNA-binding transcriptional MerR regulator